MPSGSHGGHHGSHRGGGSSFRGSSFRSGRSSSRRPARPMTLFFFGRHYYVPVEKASVIRGLYSLAFTILIFVAIFLVPLFSLKADIDKIKVDREYYIAMIENAEQDSDYLKTAKVTDKFYHEDFKKWYITYTIQTDDGQALNGYTFSVYTFDEVNQFVIGQEVPVAVNSKEVTLQTDSITMDYKDIPLESDGEFIQDSKQIKVLMTLSILGGTASVTIIVVATVLLFKRMKKNELEKTLAEDPSFKEEGVTRCKYCGSKVDSTDKSCKNCGAGL